MNDDRLLDAIAARASGLDAPDVDPAELDARLSADPAAAAELASMRELCRTLERAVPTPPARTNRPRRTSARWLVVAAALVITVAGALIIGRGGPTPEGHAPTFGGFLAAVRSIDVEARYVPPRPTPRFGGAGESAEGALVPFAAQLAFPLLAPVDDRLVQAARLGAESGERPHAWLELLTQDGPAVVLCTPGGPGAGETLTSLHLPAGWRRTTVTRDGTAALVASPVLDADALDELAAGLRPVR